MVSNGFFPFTSEPIPQSLWKVRQSALLADPPLVFCYYISQGIDLIGGETHHVQYRDQMAMRSLCENLMETSGGLNMQ